MKQSKISIKILTLLLTLSIGNITMTMHGSSASAASGAGAGSGASSAVGVSYGNHGSDEMQLSYYLTANQNQSNIDPNILRKIRANILTVDIADTKAACSYAFGDDALTKKEIDEFIADAQSACTQESASETELRHNTAIYIKGSKIDLLKYVGLLRFKPYGLINIEKIKENIQTITTNQDLNIQYTQYIQSSTDQLRATYGNRIHDASLLSFTLYNQMLNQRLNSLLQRLTDISTEIIKAHPALSSYDEFMTLFNDTISTSYSLPLHQLLHFLVFNKSDHLQLW